MSYPPADLPWPPVVSILGHSDSGKTMLVERLVPRLRGRGLRVAVVKHCSHGIDVDHPGKDSDRIFKSGADVLAVGPDEAFLRLHAHDMPARRWLHLVPQTCDVVLVEGFRDTAFPKIRLRGTDWKAEVRKTDDTLLVLEDAEQGCDAAEQAVWDVVARVHAALPVYAAVLVGRGAARRESSASGSGAGETVAHAVAAATPHARQVVLVGSRPLPEAAPNIVRLPAAPEVPDPMAGVLSAMRWQPKARWIVLACDSVAARPEAVPWLLSHARPGIDVVSATLGRTLCGAPLLAAFEPTARPALEQAAGRGQCSLEGVLGSVRVFSLEVPAALSRTLGNEPR